MLGGSVPECDVIVKGVVGTTPRGWVRESSGSFRDDTNALWTDANVRALAATDGPLTYTCAPPGSGRRMGIDRNLDGNLDSLPEPGSLLSLASGAALVAALARRSARASAHDDEITPQRQGERSVVCHFDEIGAGLEIARIDSIVAACASESSAPACSRIR
jgi:hypothetical protein